MTNIINADVIRDFYEDFCENENLPASESDFEAFVAYLEIDFFDWLRQNLDSFKNQIENDSDSNEIIDKTS